MPKGIYKKTNEQIEKMRKSLTGRNLSYTHKKNIGLSHLGKIHTKETKEKISKSNKGKKNLMAKYNSQIFTLGHIPVHKGKKLEKLTGENNPRWKGGYKNKLHLNRTRYILKMGNSGSHTLGEWEHLKAMYNWTCPCCYKTEPKIKLTEDHIIPLSKGGSNNIENIQPLCRSCNSRKNNKLINKYVI